MQQKPEQKQPRGDQREDLVYYQYLELIDRIIRGADGLEEMMDSILTEILQIYDCDRAFLYYPCDPDAESWRIPMIKTKPEYYIEIVMKQDIPMQPEVSSLLRKALDTEEALYFSETGPLELPEIIREHGARSILIKTLHPKFDKPWLLGIHQCREEREWIESEKLLFVEIGRRLSDAIATLTTVKNLSESEKRFRRIAENARDIIFRMSLPDGNFEYISPAVEELVGFTPQELYQDPRLSLQIVHPDWLTYFLEEREKLARVEIAPFYEYKIINRQGAERWVNQRNTLIKDDAGNPIALEGIVTDITHQKRTESELRDKRDEAQMFLDIAGVMIIAIDREQKVTLANRKAREILGCEEKDIIGKNWFDNFLFIDDIDSVKKVYNRVIAGEMEAVEYFENPVRSKSGDIKLIAWHNTVIRDENGDITHSLSSGEDITERRKAENEKLKAEEDRNKIEEQLRQSQKMESIGKLAGGIAHDFNNLLTSILGNCDMAISELRPEDPLYLELSEINEGAERAADLTRQLLAFSRKQVMEPRILNLNTVISNMDKMLKRIIGEDIILDTRLYPELWNTKVDPSQIEQVILNLAVNARDAMPEGGRLFIETDNIILDSEYEENHPEAAPGEYVMLAVSDTGCGIDKEIQANIFDPFFSTKEIGKGTGLGLSTVYGIIKQSGGNIWVYSEKGKGTTFKVYIPRMEGEPDTDVFNESNHKPPSGTETVIVVEDDSAVRSMSVKVLRQLGYKVYDAQNGGEALLICESLKVPVDLIVTDVIMPKMSGVEFVDRIRGFWKGVKALYISGYTPNYIVHQGMLEAGIPYLQKPFRPLKFAEKVREVIDEG